MNRIFNCTGIPILRLGRWRVELWLVPRGAEIPDHRHRHLNAWLLLLGGTMTWHRAGKRKRLRGPVRPMLVSSGVIHGAFAHTRAAFLTVEHWAPGIRITSAAHDLQLA